MNELLAVLSNDGGEEEALRASFEAAARGFGAQKALLLVIEQPEPLRLRAVHTLGQLTTEQIAACERGDSVRGVSPSLIQRVVASGRPELIEDPRTRAEASRTPSLSGGPYSVLCAPISDPVRDAVLAVIYLQNSGLLEAYGESDLAWLEGYAGAVGRLFGLSFRQALQDRELKELREARGAADNAPEILGDSSHTQGLRRVLHETFIPAIEVENPEPILILGERGTGKDLIARYIHAYSSRHKRPLVVVSCAEITDELAASRFFGHKRGSFTGALTDEPGFFRAADGGVLFLDEIAELTPRAQAHLLRVLENHTVVPVGQTREYKTNVAVVLATNRDLDQAVREGALRADFYDRFRTLSVRLLPLRERPWDIPPLLEHYRRHHERKHRKPTLGFHPRRLPDPGVPRLAGKRARPRPCLLALRDPRPARSLDRSRIDRPLSPRDAERCAEPQGRAVARRRGFNGRGGGGLRARADPFASGAARWQREGGPGEPGAHQDHLPPVYEAVGD
jgi:transcriptional regulator with GAF, ATPase, and Fis domain